MDGKTTLASPESLLAHVEWVRRLARALVRPDDADDVVQQTYAQALVAPPPSHNLRGWLGAIARNIVRRGARDAATRTHHETRAPSPGHAPDPVESVARAELHRRVVEAVLALDEPYRSTLVMRFFDDQPADAIARAVNVPVETVRTRVKQGIARLRARLEKSVGGDDAAGVAARALWFERLRAFAGDGTKGSVVGGAAAATVVVVMTMRASWIGTGVAAAALVVTAAWWIHARNAANPDAGANARAGALATRAQQIPIAAAAPASLPMTESPTAATRTVEKAEAASAPAAMKPFVGRNEGVIRGRVKDGRGEPVAGAEVKALRGASGGGSVSLGGYALAAWQQATAEKPRPLPAGVVLTHSDASGRFEFDALSTIPDWCVGALDRARGAAITDPVHFDEEHLTHEVEVTLVACALVRGSVHDEEGRPIADALVSIGVHFGDGSTWGLQFSGADGSWSAGYECGTSIQAGAEASGFAKAQMRSLTIPPSEKDLVIDLVLQSNGDRRIRGPIVDAARADVDLKKQLAASLGPESEERQAIGWLPERRIAMGAVGPEDPNPVPGKGLMSNCINGHVDLDSGSYEVPLPASFHGTLFLATHGIVIGTAAIDDVTRPPPLPFDVKSIPPKRVTSRLVVHLIDAETKAPIDLGLGDVAATAPLPTHTPYGRIATRDAQPGVAEFVVSPARIAIRADLVGYAPIVTEFVVNPEERRREVTILLDRARAGLRGRALRVDGSAIQQSSVTLYRVTPNGIVEATGSGSGTNAYGEFEIVGLAAAEHVVVVTAPDEACAVARVRAADPPAEFELHAIHGTRTEIHLKPPPVRQGIGTMFRIVDEDGIPVMNTFGGWGTSACDWETTEVLLRPGSYHLIVWRPFCREASRDFDVPSDDPIELEIESTH